MLKPGIAFLARFVILAIVVEAIDGKPGPICCRLTRLGVQERGKRVLFGQGRTVTLQIVLVGTTPIYPLTHTLIADELNDANGFVYRCILLLVAVQFVLVDQH
jgi:hypothetical protein